CTSMRVLATGACAAAGGTRPRTKPVAAAPIKKLLRAGCAGARGGSQHRQARTSLRRSELADIASLVVRPDLNGCPDLLPGSASAHARIIAAERHGATRRGDDSRAADRALLARSAQAFLVTWMHGLVATHRAEVHLISRTTAR